MGELKRAQIIDYKKKKRGKPRDKILGQDGLQGELLLGMQRRPG